MSRLLPVWRKPDCHARGSVSPPSNGRTRKRNPAIAALRSKPGNKRRLCSPSSEAGVKESRMTVSGGARRSTPSCRGEKEWDRFCSMPFRKRWLTLSRHAPAESVRRYRRLFSQCELLWTRIASTRCAGTERNSFCVSIVKRTESYGARVSRQAVRWSDGTATEYQQPGGSNS